MDPQYLEAAAYSQLDGQSAFVPLSLINELLTKSSFYTNAIATAVEGYICLVWESLNESQPLVIWQGPKLSIPMEQFHSILYDSGVMVDGAQELRPPNKIELMPVGQLNKDVIAKYLSDNGMTLMAT